MKTQFYVCPKCGNVIIKLVDSGVVPTCCGEPMQVMDVNTEEAMQVREKHVPVIVRENANTIRIDVGALPHPMSKDHHISFIYLETEHGGQWQALKPEQAAIVRMSIGRDRPTAVYAYCNVHGLWSTAQLPEQKNRICCPWF